MNTEVLNNENKPRAIVATPADVETPMIAMNLPYLTKKYTPITAIETNVTNAIGARLYVFVISKSSMILSVTVLSPNE